MDVRTPVHSLLAPASIAIVGASPREDSLGFRLLRNLTTFGFAGRIVPVNARYDEVAGLRCYPSLAAVPGPVDAVFLAVPAAAGPDLLSEAAAAGVRAAVVPASGYADAASADGRALQARLRAIAAEHGIAVCGPNNMGLINVHDGVALWTAMRLPEIRPGRLAVVSQSGSVAIALSQDERRLGLSYIISTGNEAVLSVADFLMALGDDERVGVIGLFLETVRDPALFAAAAAKAIARGKTIVAIKVGRSERGRAAVAAHTGALAGDNELYAAFFREHGIVPARDLDELVEVAALFLAYPTPPPCPHMVALTLSGGEAALVGDLAVDASLSLPPLTAATRERLAPAFPPSVTPFNPLDVWGLGWDAGRFRETLRALLDEEEIGTVAFAVDAPASGGADSGLACQMARACAETGRDTTKRFVFLNNMAGPLNAELASILVGAGIPYLSGMRPGLGAVARWIAAGERPRRGRSALASPVDERLRDDLARSLSLSEPDRFSLLRARGVPMVECLAVASAAEGVAVAERLGYPVVLKASGPELLHKSDLGLVRVGLRDADAVAAAYVDLTACLRQHARSGSDPAIVVQPMVEQGIELIVGVRNHAGFGSLVVVGLGGVYVEVLRDVAVRMGAVDRDTALAMLTETRAGALLQGVRGKGPYDSVAAADAIVALSRFGAAGRGVLAAVEVNPLIVREAGRGAAAVDLVLEPIAAGDARSL